MWYNIEPIKGEIMNREMKDALDAFNKEKKLKDELIKAIILKKIMSY